MTSTNSQARTDAVVGRTIVAVSQLGPEELAGLCWSLGYAERAYVLELDDGGLLLPQCDPEGNGPGFLHVDDDDAIPTPEALVGRRIEGIRFLPMPRATGATILYVSAVGGGISETIGVDVWRDAEGNGWGAMFYSAPESSDHLTGILCASDPAVAR